MWVHEAPQALAWAVLAPRQAPPPPISSRHCLLPSRTPAMIGCSFVVDREYFGDIGLLDPGMEVYGGENIELGMRVSGLWRALCGCWGIGCGQSLFCRRDGCEAPN